MTDSQSALRELQRFLGGFKALLPVLENAASIESQVKAGEARLVALKMETTEAQGHVNNLNETYKLNEESLKNFIKEKNDEGKKIRESAEAYAAQTAGEANAQAKRILDEANANVRERETLVTNLKADAAKLKGEIVTLTEKRDGLRTEIGRIKKGLEV